MLIGSMIFCFVIFMMVVSATAFYIVYSYREFDRRETMKEDIVELRAKIKGAQDYFRDSYEYNLYNDIKLNIDLCIRIICNKGLEEQISLFKRLYEVLYETGYRLKSNNIDINMILKPIQSFRAKLVEDHLSYIKDNSEDPL